MPSGSKGKAAKPVKKAAPRAKGRTARPPARKAAKPAAAKGPAARTAPKKAAGARKPAPPPTPRRPPSDATWAPATAGWTPAHEPRTQAPQWTPAPAPAPTPAPGTWTPVARPAALGAGADARAFDPASGQWLPTPAFDAGEVDPAAYLRGATRSILSNVLLGITLGIAALFLLFGLVVGIILVAAPESAWGERLGEELEGGASSPGFVIVNALVTFVMFGLVPFVWVLGTRVVPWRGTVKYLQLRVRWKDWLLGVALVPAMIAAVYALLVVYTCATEGCGALDDEPDEGSGLDDMLANLTWPVVVVVALCAGIGEEILFRGVLQRWIGVWGQAAAFGLAHAANAYPPQVIFAFGLGAVFGYLFRRGWSLVSLMVAHTLYDFTLLTIAMLYPEIG